MPLTARVDLQPMSRSISVEYLVLRCADLERSRTFYEALGMAPKAEQHGSGPRHYSCTVGDMVLELYPLAGKPSAGVRIGLRVPDLAAVVAALQAIGGELVRAEPPPASCALVRDPDGHDVMLTEVSSVAAAWADEIAARVRAVSNGTAELHDASELFAELEQELNKRHPG